MPRTERFQRDPRQEQILETVNRLLSIAEREAAADTRAAPRWPLVFVVGAPRSGTTLMMQWLASSGEFAYPTNLLSRFYQAPFVGGLIQRLLTDPELDYKNELADVRTNRQAWSSEVGKTQGVLQPHEFFYFWRRFFPIDQAQKLTEDQRVASDPVGFVGGWAAIEEVFDRPLATKGILLQYDITLLAEWLPQAIFVHTRRDPFFNAQSLLEARKKVSGDPDIWFSVRPPGYEWLKDQDRHVQVVGQIFSTERAIESALRTLPSHRSVSVPYEAYCGDPRAVWVQLQQAMSEFGYDLGPYNGPNTFDATNVVRCDAATEAALRSAVERLSSINDFSTPVVG